MKRHILNINDYKYLIEYFDCNQDENKSIIGYSTKFVMLRNFNIVNNIVTDTDIIFIEKEIYKNILEEFKTKQLDVSDLQVFPISGANVTGYSQKYSDFNNTSLNIISSINAINDITDNEQLAQYIYNKQAYLLYEKNGNTYEEKDIKCNYIRLYHPATLTNLNGIICIKNVINDINIYYICNKLSNYQTQSVNEITINNDKYMEYIEIYFPNIEELFGTKKSIIDSDNEDYYTAQNVYSTYFSENMNIVVNEIYNNTNNFSTDVFGNTDIIEYIFKQAKISNSNISQPIPLNLLIQPFKISEALYYNDKIYANNELGTIGLQMLRSESEYSEQKNCIYQNIYNQLYDLYIQWLYEQLLNDPNPTNNRKSYDLYVKEHFSECKTTLQNKDGYRFNNWKTQWINTHPEYQNIDITEDINDKLYELFLWEDNQINKDTKKYVKDMYFIEYSDSINEFINIYDNYQSALFEQFISHSLTLGYNKEIIVENITDWINIHRQEIKERQSLCKAINVKKYIDIDNATEDNTYVTFPFNIIIFPFDEISTDYTYQLSTKLSTGIISIMTNSSIILAANLGFDVNPIRGSKLSIFVKFLCPKMEQYSSISEAYLNYNHVTLADYEEFYENTLSNKINNVKYEDISEYELKAVENQLKIEGIIVNRSNIVKKYQQLLKEQYMDEYNDELGVDPDFIGVRIEIATDNAFSNLVYYNDQSIQISKLQNFNFNIDGLFKDWNERPDKLIARVIFIDRFLGKIIISNYVVITKEFFKYIINNDLAFNKIHVLDKANKQINENMSIEYILDKDKINFFNNINCIVRKTDQNAYQSKGNSSPKVIFKPIFYKVQDLQNIQVRQSVTQNIGINLFEFLSKVEIFKLLIDGKEIIESARNDMYVIFNIDGKQITSYSGKYDIVNQDDEYISSGSWTLI